MGVQELELRIKDAATKYYEGHPEISDEEFDRLIEQLEHEDPNSEILKKVGWGYSIKFSKETRPHRFEVAKFESKVRDAAQLTFNRDYYVSRKIDGGSVCCYYSDGRLDYAITRGDGELGYDVTNQMSHIIPVVLSDTSFTGLVRGEIIISNDIFSSKYPESSSARNTAIGLLKRNELSVDEIKDLSFVAYTVRGTSQSEINSKSAVFSWLDSNKFEVVEYYKNIDLSKSNLDSMINTSGKYLADGLVITTDSYTKLEDGTYVPDKEVAYKLELGSSAEVEVVDIDWNLTRTGKLAPRVWFTPVELAGATCQKATAFNARYIRESKIGIGSRIVVQRSGDIIPDIVEVLTEVPYDFPKKCMHCGSDLHDDGVNLYCRNRHCIGNELSNTHRWIEVLASVKGLGYNIIDGLLEEFNINTVEDLYDRLDTIENSLTDSATDTKVRQMISYLRETPDFDDFIVALSIPGVGYASAQKLHDHYDLIVNSTDSVPDNASNLLNKIFDNIERVRHYLKFFPSAPNLPTKVVEESPIGVVEITGKLSLPRSQFIEKLKSMGWTVGSIKSADYLITNTPNSGSTKNKRAIELGVKVITESDFLKMIGE